LQAARLVEDHAAVFTGIVEATAPIVSLERRDQGARLRIGPPRAEGELAGWDARLGESLSVSGCCLSIALLDERGLAFDLSAETLALTWFGRVPPGKLVNLERPLRLADRLGGHLVSGHVDGVGRIGAVLDSRDGGKRFAFEVPAGLERYLIEKGSVCLDGISLTVVGPRGPRFEVAVIPETLARTSLGSAREGEPVHVEADLVGKWIEHLARPG
jgi:riboflavin synthase